MKIKIREKFVEVELCDTPFKKMRGMMFRKNRKSLLFAFKKPTRQPIHSLFCKPFLAIWMKNGEIVDEKIVKPFSLSVRPKEFFTHLVEIPLKNSNNFKILDGKIERFKYKRFI